MSLLFNTSPYYDDFNSDKNYHRILFKAGYAVQARELTQVQSIQQDQITKFADNIFKPNTPVSGGQITTNLKCDYIKLSPTFLDIYGANHTLDIISLTGATIQDISGSIIAKVIAIVPAISTLGDPDTLVVSYLSGLKFANYDNIYDSLGNIVAQINPTNAIGSSSVVSIAQGVFYVSTTYKKSDGTDINTGTFVQVNPQTIVLSTYSNTPDARVGLNIVESISTFVDDPSLLDPALGSSNYQAPGADRYKISLVLETRPLTLGNDDSFIELVRIEAGQIIKMVDGSVYNVIDDYLAKRTYETNGDYVVDDFKLVPSSNSGANTSLYDLKIGKGTAFIRGYRINNQADITITSNRARTTANIINNSTFMEYGNYLYINSLNSLSSAFDVTTLTQVDLHITPTSNIITSNTQLYQSTVAATAFVRNLEYVKNSQFDLANTYVYKAYITGIQNNRLTANANTATSNTISFTNNLLFSNVANVYNGVVLSIDSGTSKNDIRRVISSNGTTRTLTVDSPFSVTPDNTSIVSLRLGIKDVESIVHLSGTTINASANIALDSRDTGLSTGNTVIQEIVNPELIYTIGNPYVASMSGTSYNTTVTLRNVSFTTFSTGCAATLTFAAVDASTNNLQFLGNTPENYIVFNNATGNIVPFGNTARTIVLGTGSYSVTLTALDVLPFTGTVIAKAAISNADAPAILRVKSLIAANTTGVNLSGVAVDANNNVDSASGQTYIKFGGLVTPGTPQDLYVSDVKRIVKIIDTLSPATAPTTAMLSNSSNDVTTNYLFDNGQRDSWYQHATITLRSGRPAALGQLLVCYDWYQHSGTTGYFNGTSYIGSASTPPELYTDIPTYTAKSGTTYALRDCIDFRPAVVNYQKSFVFGTGSSAYGTALGSFVPTNNSTIKTTYNYYLGRRDKLILSKDKNFTILQGTPSINPNLPGTPDGALIIANLYLDPYTSYVSGETPNGVLPSLSVEKIQHKRWTMSDISDLQSRVNAVEYYTALNTLEKSAQSLQIPDVNGLNRFKNGILVDDFSSFAASDTNNIEYNVNINTRDRILTASQLIDNFPLHQQHLVKSLDNLDDASKASLGFAVNSIGKSNIFSLPYTSVILANQKLASNTINVNPYATPIFDGIMELTPSIDNWVDNTKQPDLLIVDPNLTLYQSSAKLNTLQTGDWKVIPGTQVNSTSQTNVVNHGAFNGPFGGTVGYTQTTTQTYAAQDQKNVLGYYQKLGSSYNQQGGYITDVSILPYIRPQQIVFRAHGLAINTPVKFWFDGVNVDQYIHNPDIIELVNCVGVFNDGDVIGYYQSSIFYPVGKVVSTYTYPNTLNTRLYIIGSYQSSFSILNTDLPINTIQNAKYNSSGIYSGSTAHGTLTTPNVIITSHKTGLVTSVGGTFLGGNATALRLYKVWTNHGAFSDAYGIWGSPTAKGAFPTPVKLWFTITKAATYNIRVSADDNATGSIQIDTNAAFWSGTPVNGSGVNYDSTVSLSVGQHYILFTGLTPGIEDDGDAYIAVAISSAVWSGSTTKGTIVFSTDLVHKYANTVPTAVNTVSTLPGGGLYFVGVTQLSLNGLANTSANYYTNSTITISSQYIEVNQYTGVSTITPKNYNIKITAYDAANCSVTLASAVNISLGYNSYVGGIITSKYSLVGTANSYNLGIIHGGLETFSTDESGSITGVFNIPASTFKTGERIFKIDNRILDSDSLSATTYASSVFTASGLSTKSQSINFSPSISSAKNTFVQTKYKDSSLISTNVTYAPYDPIAQTFIVDSKTAPNGTFISSIRLFFATKAKLNIPIILSIVGTQNGYPNGETLDGSIVTKYPNNIVVPSTPNPNYLDANTYTEFVFSSPVYIQPDKLYAFIVHSVSTEYNVFIAVKGSTAIASSVKNALSDPTPSVITKIGNVPYIGSLFVSQNSMTWTADQGQSLMFVINRCNFDITKTPKLPFVVPANLPYRKLPTSDITSYYDANNVSNLYGSFAGNDVLSNAYNITTTDFVHSATNINYSYQATRFDNNLYTTETYVTPGKFGCPTLTDIYLNDGIGPRVLDSASDSSFVLYAQLSSTDPFVSPILSDDGLSLYNIQWNINNLGLSNNTVTIASGGTGYSNSSTTVSVSYPTGTGGIQATATANISNGAITSVNFTNVGAGYTTTPTITILDPTTRASNSNASIVINGETSSSGGNGLTKYFTKKVVLTAGNDSGDLRVFYTAYRPVGTNISIYYKILNRNDTQEFNAGYWQLMTNITNSNTYSISRDNTIEYEAAPGINNSANNLISYVSTSGTNYTSFSQFAIKIVLSTSDNTSVPFLTDIRALALPSGTGA
jgi:hypothetical protein